MVETNEQQLLPVYFSPCQPGTVGTFAPSITSEGTLSKDAFTASNIKSMNVKYNAGRSFENLRRDAEFEKTTTRKAQAAALKAENEGRTSADWAEDAEQEGEGD